MKYVEKNLFMVKCEMSKMNVIERISEMYRKEITILTAIMARECIYEIDDYDVDDAIKATDSLSIYEFGSALYAILEDCDKLYNAFKLIVDGKMTFLQFVEELFSDECNKPLLEEFKKRLES